MAKAVVKYLLTLCILLLSGYSQLSAGAHLGSRGHSPAVRFAGSEWNSSVASLPRPSFIVKSPSSGTKKDLTSEVAEIVEVEEEDDKSTASKKIGASDHHFTTLFYALTAEYFSTSFKNCLSFCKQFSLFSSHPALYIILRVFRI